MKTTSGKWKVGSGKFPALEEILKKEWKELTPLERVVITAHELDLHDDERQDVIEPAAAELANMNLVMDQLQQALHIRDAQLARLRAIEAAAQHAEAALRKASKESTENGWIETAPQYFEWLADSLAAALKGE